MMYIIAIMYPCCTDGVLKDRDFVVDRIVCNALPQ